MALSDADKAEIKGLMAESFADGIALFRSRAEEEEAKTKAAAGSDTDKTGKETTSDANADGFSLAGWLLGGK
jgi:hypothetical protein